MSGRRWRRRESTLCSDLSQDTLLGSITWEQIEPVEGKFDFSELDKVITAAREHSISLVLLWFGSYKNASSSYAPSWVKRDSKRFPRIRTVEAGGRRKIIETVTPLSTECAEADARAFGKLMAHVKDFDAEHSTVLMVQVQNEPGLLGDSRDRSSIAEAAFTQPVPETLLRHLAGDAHPRFKARFQNIPKEGKHSWEEGFGSGAQADEVFMAYHFARYLEKVAAAGKSSYAIPHYANVWLNLDSPDDLDPSVPPSIVSGASVAGGAKPGVYPSGGACPHVLDVWQHEAPSLDFISPDVYLQDYDTICRDYSMRGNTLFIPEQRRDEVGARRAWLAYGTYGALGVSPFGIDNGPEAIGRAYKLLGQVQHFVLNASLADRFGFFFDEPREVRGEMPWVNVFEDIQVTVERAEVPGKLGPGGGMIIRLATNKFLLVGYGYQASFKSLSEKVGFTGILGVKELAPDENGSLRLLRLLNGDETNSGSAMVMPNDKPDLGDFPIESCIPVRTGIAEVEVYVLEENP